MDILEQGVGIVSEEDNAYDLRRPISTDASYSNAQIHDYGGYHFQHRAPLRLRLDAQFSHSVDDLRGTAGFGFWNHPFDPHSWRMRLPQAVWFFFGSPPLELPLALDVPAHGFKAATMDAVSPLFWGLLPFSPLGFLLTRIPAVYRPLWRIGQHSLRVSEHLLTHDITTWRAYALDWSRDGITFSIDDAVIYRTTYSPSGKLGFVAWIDNQYAIVTPQGKFGWGLLDCEQEQWLKIRDITIQNIPNDND